eukprot:GILJ01000915.1.p1 GENE.GILJ01000915.1~~GILJ01000915.1.p1  ORF type:complete len:190 (+),score=32.31 GILJ01000915.1:46-615(+)
MADTAAPVRFSLTQKSDNPRGIPCATFISNVEEALQGEAPESFLKRLQELYQKYKFMETTLLQKKLGLKSKLPDIRKTLDMVVHLEKQKDSEEEATTHFLMADNIWAEAKLPKTEVVYLWLGANVMLEYPFDEAEALLSKNLQAAQINLEKTEEDLLFLRDQITTSEVNIARVHNYNVKHKQTTKPVDA